MKGAIGPKTCGTVGKRIVPSVSNSSSVPLPSRALISNPVPLAPGQKQLRRSGSARMSTVIHASAAAADEKAAKFSVT
jgi:hypothetical protein